MEELFAILNDLGAEFLALHDLLIPTQERLAEAILNVSSAINTSTEQLIALGEAYLPIHIQKTDPPAQDGVAFPEEFDKGFQAFVSFATDDLFAREIYLV